MTKTHDQRTLLTLILVALLASCSVPPSTPTETPHTPNPSRTPMPTEAITPQPTATPEPTDTATPIPTYSLDQAVERITGWVDDNDGCQLPCLWGFTPGQTDRADIDLLHATFEEMYLSENIGIWVKAFDDQGGITLISYEGDVQTNIDMTYSFKSEEKLKFLTLKAKSFNVVGSGSDRVLEYIFGDEDLLEFVDDYTLPAILNAYVSPTSILIAPYFNERPELPDPSWIWYSVVLIYEDQGFLIEYIMPRRMIGESFAACLEQNTEITIITWDPEQSIPLKEVLSVKSGLGINENFLDYFIPLEEATTQTIDEFADVFRVPGTDACVYTPMELWPNP